MNIVSVGVSALGGSQFGSLPHFALLPAAFPDLLVTLFVRTIHKSINSDSAEAIQCVNLKGQDQE